MDHECDWCGDESEEPVNEYGDGFYHSNCHNVRLYYVDARDAIMRMPAEVITAVANLLQEDIKRRLEQAGQEVGSGTGD